MESIDLFGKLFISFSLHLSLSLYALTSPVSHLTPFQQLYLNDSFSAGQTTFFLPSTSEGILNAYPVKPTAGCALVFPHGDTRGSLLHEGSPVGEGGVKYVIRTDVLYNTGGRKRKEGEEGMKTEL